MKKRSSNLIWILGILLLTAATAGIVLYLLTDGDFTRILPQPGAEVEETASAETQAPLPATTHAPEKWEEGVITYRGKKIQYNSKLKTYLFMGIDKSGPVELVPDGNNGGQSDAMFLLVLDHEKKEITVIAINRNTMATVDVYAEDGTYRGKFEVQICLQHAYGDAGRISCTRAVTAVERLFYNIPISGYLAMNLDGMTAMADSVGGVQVTLEKDFENTAGTVSYKAGETVNLMGEEAYTFLRSRDVDLFNSATDRLDRQILFMNSFLGKLKTMMNRSKSSAAALWEAIEPYTVTNMEIVSMAEDFYDYDMKGEILTLPGQMVMGDPFEEYNLDENAFYELIVDVFYKTVEE